MKQQELQSKQPVGEFSTGLCDFCSDKYLCCLTCLCPCITFGRIAEILDRGVPSCEVSGTLYTLLMCFAGCQWAYSCPYRSKLKAQYGMKKDYCADCITHLCCGPCALCQEYRELQNHGYDVALGWRGHVEKNPGMMPPSVPGDMNR